MRDAHKGFLSQAREGEAGLHSTSFVRRDVPPHAAFSFEAIWKLLRSFLTLQILH